MGCGVDSRRVSWRATTDTLLWWRAARGVVKCWEYGSKIRWTEFFPFHENTGFTLTLLEKDPQNSNSEESSKNRETFSWSKFSPATGVITQIDDLSRNLDFARPYVVKICARPHLSSKSWYLFWVLNPGFTILPSFPMGNSLAMTAIYLGAVALSLRMSPNISPRNLPESLIRSCVLFF